MNRINTIIWSIIFILCLSLVFTSQVFAGQSNNVDAYIYDWTDTEYLIKDLYQDTYPNSRKFQVWYGNSMVTIPFSSIKRIVVIERSLLSYSAHISARQYRCFGEIILRDNNSLTCYWFPNGLEGINNYGGNISIGKNYWKEIRFADSHDSRLTNSSQVPSNLTLYPYTIHVSSYRDKNVSNRAAMNLRKKGIPAFVCQTQVPGKGNYYRVFVGYYRTFRETRKAALELKGLKDLHPLEAKMPYAIQLGIFESDQELKNLEADIQSKGYLTYTIPEIAGTKRSRLLIGAYRAENDSEELTQTLQKEGFAPRLVSR